MNNITTSVFSLFTPPFEVDAAGIYVFDSAGNMAASQIPSVNHKPVPRGWGRIQHFPHGNTQMAFPMYTSDLKQLADLLSNPMLPKQNSGEHDALNNARWNRKIALTALFPLAREKGLIV